MAKCKSVNIGMIVGTTFLIIVSIIIIVSLDKLEKSNNCDCSKIPERRFIKEWFIFIIIFSIIKIIIFSIYSETCWNNFNEHPYIYGVLLIISLINLVMFVRLFIYLNILRQNCECGYGNKEIFIFWYLIVAIIIIIITIKTNNIYVYI